jgi:hypothetical protein
LLVLGLVAALVIGVQAAAFADWTAPQNLLPAGTTRVSEPAQIAYDGSGTAYMLYVVNPLSRDGQLWLRTRPIGGAWSAPQSVPTAHNITNGIQLAVNNAGDMVVAWYDGATIDVEQRPAGGSWGPIVNYDAPGTAGPHQGCSFFPKASIGNDGTAAVAWPVNSSCNGGVTVWRAMAAVYKPGTGWDASPQGWSLSPINVNSYPDVAVADDGSVTVAFLVASSVNDAYPYTVERDSAWNAPEQRSTISTGNSTNGPAVVARNGRTLLAWIGFNSELAMEKVGGQWQSVHSFAGPINGGASGKPPIALDGAGNGYIARGRNVGNGEVWLGTILADGSETDFPISDLTSDPVPSANDPQIAANANGDVAAVWKVYNSPNVSVVGSLRPAGGTWPATPTTITPNPISNQSNLLSRVAVDPYGHATAVATPMPQGFASEIDASVETRDPASPPDTDPPAVSPSAAQAGNTVTCNPGTFHGTAPFSYTYAWLVDSVVVPGATGSTYSVRSQDAGSGIACEVTATNDAGNAVADSAEILVNYTPPGSLTPPTINGTIEAGRVITCDPGTWSGAPDPDLTYQWLRNGSPIAFETSDSYYVDVPDAGKNLVCRVTASNPGGTQSQNSASVLVPAVSAPKVKTRPVLTGPSPAGIGDTLTCSDGVWTGAPTPTLAHDWLRNGAVIPFEYASTYVVTAADAATTITCRVTGINVVAETPSVGSGSRAIAPAPVNTRAPTVTNLTGTKWAVGGTATCNNGGWTNALTFTYQWLQDGVELDGVTGKTRPIVAADAGTTLSCNVTATGRGGTATAIGTGKLVPAAPTLVTAPVITGTPRPAHILRCNRGTWTGASSFTLTWLRDGSAVSTGASYTAAVADVGHVIVCRVVATGAGGSLTADTVGVTIQP